VRSADDLKAHYGDIGLMSGYWDVAMNSLDKNVVIPKHRRSARTITVSQIASRCSRIPTVSMVAKRIDVKTAEQYRADLETLQNNNVVYSHIGEMRKGASKLEVYEVVHTVRILAAFGDLPDVCVAEYERFRRHLTALRTAKRRELGKKNTPYINKAKSLGIWMPKQRDIHKWSASPHSHALFGMVRLTRLIMTSDPNERGVLQYIPKRRPTADSLSDIQRNIECMKNYCNQYVSDSEKKLTCAQ
jgi:hypothetical protein